MLAHPESKTDTPRRVVSTEDAALRVGVCTKTLRRYVTEGRLTAYRLGPRSLRFDVDELDALLVPVSPTSIK